VRPLGRARPRCARSRQGTEFAGSRFRSSTVKFVRRHGPSQRPPRSRSRGCCSARAERSSDRCRDKRCSVSSIGEEMGGLGLVPARTMRATAADCLLPLTSQAIRKHLRDRGVGAGVAPEFIVKRNSQLVGIRDGAPTTPSVSRFAKLRAAHHGGESPALRSTHYFCNRTGAANRCGVAVPAGRPLRQRPCVLHDRGELTGPGTPLS
jgi:hypothetical protein